MASVTSLGLHQPTGLHYAVQEGHLPAEPPSTAYEWHNHFSAHGVSAASFADDELLVTPRCVIWSRGGVFRKSYTFDLEKEEVSRALVTTFPSVGPLSKKTVESQSRKKAGKAREPAIVVFLKTQAHVYFLSGTSHVIHLPFEVESAMAAPNGLIIQRKLRVDNLVAASLKFPRVPPNSFVSSQPQPWSAASSQRSTFSIADLGDPKQMPVPHTTLQDMWEPPTIKPDLNWPRLFSLSDPLAEMGLVVTERPDPENRKRRKGPAKLSTMGTAEEILHISRRDDFSPPGASEPLILALTLNRETSMYTVWKFAYVGDRTKLPTRQRVPSGTMSRRRSSYAPSIATGATTPVANGHHIGRDSLAGNQQKISSRKSTNLDEGRDKVYEFATSLDPDFENTAIPRRKSRRVSSMLARADLSASHERSAFNDLAAGHAQAPNRRGESLGSQHARVSIGAAINGNGFPQSSQFNNSLNSFPEGPVDELLDELRAGGDFEGFHNMGLDDDEFDALKQEILLTKVCSVPAEHSNLRYSRQHIPAVSQCKIFTLTAPPSAADAKHGNTIVICILDPDEKKLLVVTLYTTTHKADLDYDHLHVDGTKPDHEITLVSLGAVMRAKGVIDACRVDDGPTSRILVLTETPDGHGELSLQAPWSVLMKVPLPTKFNISNIRNLSHDSTPNAKRDGGFKRVLSKGPRALCGLRNAKPPGLVDLLDDEGQLHQLQLLLRPRNPHVAKTLDVCSAVLPGSRGGEGVTVCWWNVMQWLQTENIATVDMEWTALAITLFAMALGLGTLLKPVQGRGSPKSTFRSASLRSSSGAQSDSGSWELMQKDEAAYGSAFPSWMTNAGWMWLTDDTESPATGGGASSFAFGQSTREGSFIQSHVKLTHDFAATALGRNTVTECLPTCGTRNLAARKAALADCLMGLHLLREEHKLDTMTSDAFSTGNVSLTPILGQIVRWLGWSAWVEYYDLEEAALFDVDYDNDYAIKSILAQPVECPSIYTWLHTCLITRSSAPFKTLPDLAATGSHSFSKTTQSYDQWVALTPRTLLFVHFFGAMKKEWSSTRFVEALAAAGADVLVLETLPEAILAPLQEAIVQCQTEPSPAWSKDLLTIVGREDVDTLVTAGRRPRQSQAALLAPSHDSTLDFHSICDFTSEVETTGSFDGSAEVDRQAISRSIFPDDRRMNEAMNILDTSRPTVARCKSEPQWTESELLEAQKEHAQMLAYRTLAIPSGRGLLYFSARIPLLTQRWHISGFNLSCVMKPDNNTVAADKSAFSEEKVCWAFFHSGVAAGLQISRDAKGIDTSWILYNKPNGELNNRHAGFLLALGLNGHLKSVAKWVAFKYLTPKHTMTSIGLLLGLAASYIGTMDSLITRLLSVHVTRMLPPGAAELNLSPLTQTTGIMGIGLLYCNTQHRRMSEIMVSEIEHIDKEVDEEPLRNEGYRLAAGFALGFINLGKGSDLRGLHDMRLTERLLALAVGSKKVDLVHVLDKATAAAVIAITLIFMKSEDQVLARKIDVPDSLLQFDYVRPDVFLLRTVSRHLIMWSQIKPSFDWIRNNLPEAYRPKSMLETVKVLRSEDLPFYDIIAGLCFSIALRYAGSASLAVRDLLIHYLDQLMRICRIDANTYDKKLTRNTVRNCQDLVALSAATVMAGTGDLVVFRRLRSMHGRDDSETPYGSHLATHLAIGALFLGGGTFTFGTSNLAIATLLVAFYPIFPSSVHDNRSHLQAFRHFWVLAAEPRCLVARDIDTNQPVPVPITIMLRNGDELRRHTPCLLPELDQIHNVRTQSPEYWNLVLDLKSNPAHIASFKSTQTIHVRRRPAHDSTTPPFQSTLQALQDASAASSSAAAAHPLAWLLSLPAFSALTQAERALVLPPDQGGPSDVHAGTRETVIDARLVLEGASVESGRRDRLLGLRLLFEWVEGEVARGREVRWVRGEVVERLRARVWMLAEVEG